MSFSKGFWLPAMAVAALGVYSSSALAAGGALFMVGGQLADSRLKADHNSSLETPYYSSKESDNGSDSVASYGAFVEYGNKYQTWKGWLDMYNSSNIPLFDIKVDYSHDNKSDSVNAMGQVGYRFGLNKYTHFDLLLNGGYQYVNYDSSAWAKTADAWKIGAGAGLNVMVDRYNVLRAEAGANYTVDGDIRMREGENMDTDDKFDPYVELSWINQATRFAYITTLFYTRQSFDMDGQQSASLMNLHASRSEDIKRDVFGVRFGIGF